MSPALPAKQEDNNLFWYGQVTCLRTGSRQAHEWFSYIMDSDSRMMQPSIHQAMVLVKTEFLYIDSSSYDRSDKGLKHAASKQAKFRPSGFFLMIFRSVKAAGVWAAHNLK